MIQHAWHFWYAVVLGVESGLRRLGHCVLHTLIGRYVYEGNMEQTTVFIANATSESLGKLALSMAPDWPMIVLTAIVGLTSFATSRALIKVTKQNQQSTSRIKQAEIRQDWQRELRKSISELIAATAIAKAKSSEVVDFNKSPEYYICWERILVLQSHTSLLLTNNKVESTGLVSLIDDLVEHAIDSDLSMSDFASYSNAVEKVTKSLLETTWDQIKNDLDK